jgi:lipid-A-disaccharide synthase
MDGSRPPRVCIITTDPSGDAVGAALATALQARGPIELIGAGGAAMRRAGVELLCDTTTWTAIGAVAWAHVLAKAIPGSHVFRWEVNRRKPDLLVPIDSGGFNVPVTRTLRRWLRIPALYYIPPRSWSRGWRVQPLKVADYVAAPFPWNVGGDDGTGRVRFVGHPAADLPLKVPTQEEVRRELGLGEAPILAVLPGSRRFELRTHLPLLAEAVRRLRGQVPGLQVVVSRASSVEAAAFDGQLAAVGLQPATVVEGAPRALRAADAALVCFGTATLEACVLGCPLAPFYRLPPLMALEFRLLHTRLRHFTLPNILAGHEVVPELQHEDVTPERLAEAAGRLLLDRTERNSLRARLLDTARLLGPPGATERAAQAVLDVLSGEWHAARGAAEAAEAHASAVTAMTP